MKQHGQGNANSLGSTLYAKIAELQDLGAPSKLAHEARQALHKGEVGEALEIVEHMELFAKRWMRPT